MGQIWFALGVLGVLDRFFILCMPQHSFQDDLLHDLPRHRREAHWPGVPWVFLFSFLKNRSDVYFFPSTRDFTWQPRLFKYDVEWFVSHISQFLQHPGVHIIQSHRFVHIQTNGAVSDLLCSYSERNLAPPDPSWRFRDMERLTVSEGWGEELSEYLSLLLKPVLTSHLSEGIHSPNLTCETRILSCYFSHTSPSLVPSALGFPWSCICTNSSMCKSSTGKVCLVFSICNFRNLFWRLGAEFIQKNIIRYGKISLTIVKKHQLISLDVSQEQSCGGAQTLAETWGPPLITGWSSLRVYGHCWALYLYVLQLGPNQLIWNPFWCLHEVWLCFWCH